MRWAGQLIGLILVTLLSTSCSGASRVSPGQDTPAALTATPQLTANLAGRTITVGTDAEYPPFAFRTPPEQTLTGFDVELMQAVARQTGATLNIQDAPFQTLMQGLENHTYDAVAAALTIPARQQQAVFSEPYATVGQIIVVRTGTTGVASYKDLDEIGAVGVEKNSPGETVARKRSQVDDDKVRTYTDMRLAWADLASGQINALITNSVQAGQFLALPDYQQKLTRIGKPLSAESYAIAMQKDDTQLQYAVNSALAALEADGTIGRLKQKYGIE